MPRQSFAFEDFSGGLDLVSDIPDIPPTHMPFAQNFRTAPSGALEVLPGYNSNKDLGVDVNARDLFWFEKRDGSSQRLVIAGRGTGINGKWIAWTPSGSGLGGGTYTDIRTGLTAADDTTFAVHNDKLYGLDPQNIMATWDGTTLATHADSPDTGPPKGIILGIWNGKMWVAEAGSMKIRWSEVFDATNGFVNTVGMWPTANNVVLDGTGSSSEKIVGGAVTPDGLAVFTTDSIYLVYDSDDGFNTVVDAQRGCLGRRTIQQHGDSIYFLSERGVFKTNGRLPAENASPLIEPHFAIQGVLHNVMAPCGIVYDGSYWVAFLPNDVNAATSPYNRVMFEINLRTGAAMWHTTMATTRAFGVGKSTTGILPKLYAVQAGGTYDGRMLMEALEGSNAVGGATIQLPYHPSQDRSFYKRLREVRLRGDGAFYTGQVRPTTDYEVRTGISGSPSMTFTLSYPDGQYTAEFERGRARISGVRGHLLSAFIQLNIPEISLGSPTEPVPVGTHLKTRGPRISRVEMVYSGSRRQTP